LEQIVQILDHEADKIVREIGIPPCPAILTRLLREMRDDDPDYARIGAMIGSDVGLAAAMLKTVNSPFHGLHTKATSVSQALALLGLRNVVQIVTGLLLRQAFPVDTTASLEHFWDTSSSLAQICARLARPLAGLDRDDAYTFALFRDCGIPLMVRRFKDYDFLLDDEPTLANRSFPEVEDENFSMNHTRVGYQLAQSWDLPKETCIAILHHHDYSALGDPTLPETSRKLVALALAAEWLQSKASAWACPEWVKGGNPACKALGLREEDLEAYEEVVTETLAQRQ